MGAYKVRQYCRKCGEVTNATMYIDIEWVDGRAYESCVDRVECDHCGSIETSDYDSCPICGNDKSVNDDYCPECYQTTREHLKDLKAELKASQDDLECIVCNIFAL